MTSLDVVLPEELLSVICSNASPSSLCALVRCSKALNRIATPYLYAHVSFRDKGGIEDRTMFLLPFAWLIFTSPRHAAYVHSFVIETINDESTRRRNWRDSSGKGDEEVVEKVLKGVCAKLTVGEEDAAELFGLVKAENEEEGVVVAMLAASMENLTRLDFCHGSIGTDEPMMRALELVTKATRCRQRDLCESNEGGDKAWVQQRSFSRHLDLMVSGGDDKYPNDGLHVAAWMNLPNIRSLYAWKAGDHDWNNDGPRDDAFFKLEPLSCAAEYVELRQSKLHHEHFSKLLAAFIPGKLETFIYEVGCTWAWVSVHHRKIMDALAPHYSTLQTLELSHEDFFPYQFDNDAEEPDPVSFQCFTALQRLRVAPVYIWGQELLHETNTEFDPKQKSKLRNALPFTLTELWLTRLDSSHRNDCYTTQIVMPALYEALEHRNSDLPKLTKLGVTFSRKGPYHYDASRSTGQNLEWVRSLHSFSLFAKNRGIEVVIRLMNDCMDIEAERKWGWDEEVEWADCFGNPGNDCPDIVVADFDDEEGLFDKLREFNVETEDKNPEIETRRARLAGSEGGDGRGEGI